MREHYDAIRQLGAEVLVVCQARPEVLAAFLREQPLPFPVVGDPERIAYRRFGLERTSWARLLHPGIVLRFVRLMFRGWRPQAPRQREDVLQLGGDFILDAAGRLVYAYRSAEPTDRPAVATLMGVLRGS